MFGGRSQDCEWIVRQGLMLLLWRSSVRVDFFQNSIGSKKGMGWVIVSIEFHSCTAEGVLARDRIAVVLCFCCWR